MNAVKKSARRDESIEIIGVLSGSVKQGFSLKSSLESRTYRETERFARLLQAEIRGQGGNCLLEAEIARATGREHAPGDRAGRMNHGVQSQRIKGVIDTKRLLHDRQQHLKLQPS